MAEFLCRRLDPVLLPLANKFYRQHRARTRARGDEIVWLAQAESILGALRLKQIEQGFWLTGLFVRFDYRSRGIASELVSQAVGHLDAPVWLFCHPDLAGFYCRLGFRAPGPLPESLASRLARYQRAQRLVALARDGLITEELSADNAVGELRDGQF